MSEPEHPHDTAAGDSGPPSPPAATTGRMHQDVPYWADPVCSCEAEPYWEAVGEELAAEKRPQNESAKQGGKK